MKKRAARFLCMILIAVLIFGIPGCGSEEKTMPETEENKMTSEPQREEAKETPGPFQIPDTEPEIFFSFQIKSQRLQRLGIRA